MFERNEAGWDRAARVAVGLGLLGVVLFAVSGTWGVVLALVALVPLLTGIAGTCPLYSLFGVSTCPVDVRSDANA